MERIGFYCWAGPGTIRMVNLKYFNPRIDTESLMSSYDYEYLARLKDLFGITDFWATYSWGFAEGREQEDYKFLLDRVENFKKLGIKLHAYVQGPNLVYADYPGKDWWARDNFGQLVNYHRGRKVVCINNPEFQEYLVTKIRKTYDYGFDGIFMDNIQMGQLGVPVVDPIRPFVFAGCTCKHCREAFREPIPMDFELNPELTSRYLHFRTLSVSKFISEMAEVVHAGKMEFGSNSFDPKLDLKRTIGVDLSEVAKVQDYLLFENHCLPGIHPDRNNEYIDEIAQSTDKPVFVVSYKHEIGHDSQYSQTDFNNILEEDHKYKFLSCLKGSEFVTNGEWHNLRLVGLNRPQKASNTEIQPVIYHNHPLFYLPLFRRFLKRNYNRLTTWAMESRVGRNLLDLVYALVIR